MIHIDPTPEVLDVEEQNPITLSHARDFRYGEEGIDRIEELADVESGVGML